MWLKPNLHPKLMRERGYYFSNSNMVWPRQAEAQVDTDNLEFDEEDPFLTDLLVKLDNLTTVLSQYIERQPNGLDSVIVKLDTLIGLLNCYLSEDLTRFEPRETDGGCNPFKDQDGGAPPPPPPIF